ncbi:MAG: hypothetical protein PUP91_25270 [Rhizonema sp. PD37]|nr:hypothetical protein [Rhizonema sp. PD37]
MDTQINFRTSSTVKEQVEKIAESRGIKPSQLINEIVADFLNRGSRLNEVNSVEKLYELVTLHERKLEEHQLLIETLTKKSAA